MSISQEQTSYAYKSTHEYPHEYTYIATMQRGAIIESVQDGSIFCRSRETAELVVASWNKMAQDNPGEITWTYKLRGLEQ